MNISINQLRKLYKYYNPLYSDARLLASFTSVIPELTPSIDSIRDLYNDLIFKYFLNEAVIKNSYIKSFFFGKKDIVTVYELNVGKSRADIVMLNGHSVVFEIKTEYDTFNRLTLQLSDYFKVFDYINILIPLSSLDSLLSIVPDTVGIITYSKNKNSKISFRVYRKAPLNRDIDAEFQLNQLTLSQLTSLVPKAFQGSKSTMIEYILKTFDNSQINSIYREKNKEKYYKKWKFLESNSKLIKPLDYQFFFKNTIETHLIYR